MLVCWGSQIVSVNGHVNARWHHDRDAVIVIGGALVHAMSSSQDDIWCHEGAAAGLLLIKRITRTPVHHDHHDRAVLKWCGLTTTDNTWSHHRGCVRVRHNGREEQLELHERRFSGLPQRVAAWHLPSSSLLAWLCREYLTSSYCK